ncbi:septum formation initiator family protein [Crassaminicella indica]|uniref:Septum formation initiator family protein n=1 Tax=Crassaminicella indica TaxID=2855394 RepID=A0ABX8RBH8_9CLOT|nr:septum formation initiator family protein [Crassaminicella indica]QXM05807.1 septum formation initiator family protein [Crassaminicella indica]
MVVAQRKYSYVEEEIKQPQPKKSNKKKPKQKVKIKANHKVQMIFGIIMIGSLCIAILLGYARISELKYRIYGLNKEIHQLEIHIENLKVQVDGVKRSDLIEKKAREELGMQYPDKSQMVFIKLDGNNMVDGLNTEEKAQIDEAKNKKDLIDKIKGMLHTALSLLD